MSSFEDTERMIAELGKDSGPSKKKQKDDMDDILADLNSSMGSLNKGNANKQASKSVKTESDLNALEKQLYAEHGPIEFEIKKEDIEQLEKNKLASTKQKPVDWDAVSNLVQKIGKATENEETDISSITNAIKSFKTASSIPTTSKPKQDWNRIDNVLNAFRQKASEMDTQEPENVSQPSVIENNIASKPMTTKPTTSPPGSQKNDFSHIHDFVLLDEGGFE